ncbi:MAG: penicillin acylase family protein [Ignavibacterium sp.]|jgi:penicillin amidase|uniref:penicillin acylase family protein n=1 Tax=Ignavibacterium sp. TaxID=2651167 RepID=UPI0032991BC3
MPNWLKIIIGIFSSLILITIFAGIFFYKMLSSSLPEYEGAVQSNKIFSDIEVYRDSFAIPYIIADNDEDVAFALGYLHAQERLFIMDLIRRAGEGRLAEILGEKALPFDRMFRTVGIKRTILENYSNYDPQVIKILQAYSHGVNHYIEQNKGKYSIEFDVLGYQPEKWKPLHSLIIIRMMGWELNLSWWVDFTYTELLEKFGKDKLLEILPDISESNLQKIPSSNSISELARDYIKTNLEFRNLIGWRGSQVGSNNWTVNSKKSLSGKPIIANDPHLAFSAPGKWYAVVINSKNWKAAGVTLPGVPGIVIGKNENISWALTNLMNDDADYYTEKLDSSKQNYLLDGRWKPLEIIKDTIKIKNQKPETIEIRKTHRGPIISDIHPFTFVYNEDGTRYNAMSMKWLGNLFSDEMLAFLKINKAKNFNEFKEAVGYFAIPGQNFLYADKQGNIGFVMGAKIPIRSTSASTIINDGTNSVNDWKGFVPKDEMVVVFNPTENFFATANNNLFPKFKYHISNLWEPSSRIDRINFLLKQKSKHSVKDFQNYQMDQTSEYAKQIVPYILSAFKDVKVKDKNLSESLELLETWNYEMSQFNQVTSIYQVFLKYLLRNIYLDEMGEDLFNKFLFIANVPYRSLLKVLQSDSNWFDDISTTQIENKNTIIRKSLSDALTYLEKNYGKDLSNWQWGRIHKVTFKHPFSGVFNPVDRLINIGPYEIGGDGTTIFNTEYPFAKSVEEFSAFRHEEFENVLGPSMRFIFDFSKPAEFYLVLTTGQSGNLFSNHYSDMSQKWLEGKLLKIRTDEVSIKSKDKKVLRIVRAN